jgi:hypothetical protein
VLHTRKVSHSCPPISRASVCEVRLHERAGGETRCCRRLANHCQVEEYT